MIGISYPAGGLMIYQVWESGRSFGITETNTNTELLKYSIRLFFLNQFLHFSGAKK